LECRRGNFKTILKMLYGDLDEVRIAINIISPIWFP
jgi:hypothetical protein